MDRRFEFVRRDTSRIVIGEGVEVLLPELLRELGARDVVVVHDEAMAAFGSRIAARIPGSVTWAAPEGEAVKDLRHVAEATSWLRANGKGRDTTLLALGGGSLTDFTGFLASIYLRGVPFVSCPTTTLALCDAALGGKNGVDVEGRKNELGTIRQPALIAGDVAWLQTLPDARFREGFVEVVKKAVVLDADHFGRLEQLADALHARDAAATAEAIDMAVAMKMAVVLADETESDRRRWLNFGHTIGHALESLAEGALRHGECIAIGMLAECRAAGAAVPTAIASRLQSLLQRLGAPTTFPPEFADVERLWQLVRHDKKVREGRVPLVVPVAIGSGALVELTSANLARAIA